MPTKNVVLTERQEALIESLVRSGRYQNAGEVLDDGLRLVEQREAEEAGKLRLCARRLASASPHSIEVTLSIVSARIAPGRGGDSMRAQDFPGCLTATRACARRKSGKPC